MIQDPTNQYIAIIQSQCDLNNKRVLEIGCGRGRITRDLAKHATQVVASDPDSAALETARATITADNVEFVHAPAGVPDMPDQSVDVVIYTLSLHHIPVAEMAASLCKAARLLRNNGVIVVVEPGDNGSFSEVKQRFGAGSGDERTAREAAISAIKTMVDWTHEETIPFRTLFQFDDEEDFFTSMLPEYRQRPESVVNEVRQFLHQHRTANGIILEAERRLNVLRPALRDEHP